MGFIIMNFTTFRWGIFFPNLFPTTELSSQVKEFCEQRLSKCGSFWVTFLKRCLKSYIFASWQQPFGLVILILVFSPATHFPISWNVARCWGTESPYKTNMLWKAVPIYFTAEAWWKMTYHHFNENTHPSYPWWLWILGFTLPRINTSLLWR